MIENPVLRGFNPDPSICRVGDDYYIATSTFEWYPGVQIHHSRDLKHWRLLTRPLRRASQLDLTGEPDSCGVWAPCLSWHDGVFYLVYTDVRRFDGNFKDTHNYLVTCESVDGDWSEPVYLNSSGFDPSLFHDADGRKWLTNMLWDHRPETNFFGGILLQEYCAARQALVGEAVNIFPGSELGFTEAPHLYRHGNFYYLLTAEGGTGYGHAVTMARAKNIAGPYQLDPGGSVISARDFPHSPLQRTGHGDFVETAAGELYLVFLCSRPLPGLSAGRRRSPLGRETAIEKVAWTNDGWLRLARGDSLPAQQVAAPDLPRHPWPPAPARDDFNGAGLAIDFQWLRTPRPEEFYSLAERPGYLRLKGRESLGSWYTQALVARRQQAFRFSAVTKIEFEPRHFQQMAGLVSYYNASKYHYLYISRDGQLGKHLAIMSCHGDPGLAAVFPLQHEPIALPDRQPVYLRADIDYQRLVFSWSLDGEKWQRVPVVLDNSLIADEVGRGEGASFTGAFIGMCCQDLAGTRLPADFDFFEYLET